MISTTVSYINHSATMMDSRSPTSTTNFASAWQQDGMGSPSFQAESDTACAPLSPASPENHPSTTEISQTSSLKRSAPTRLNKFVRRLHDMLQSEQESGIVEWRKGLLVLHSTDTFTKKILPKYFNTKNFKTFRRQLNYYGFVHVRSFSTTGSMTTALWVNQDLAKYGSDNISSVLMLKRVEPCDSAKTAEGRRVRKEEAASTVEDIGLSTRALQMEQIRQLAIKATTGDGSDEGPDSCQKTLTLDLQPTISSTVQCQLDVDTDSSESTPSLSSTTFSVPAIGADDKPDCNFHLNDAANLLIMFSKSIQPL